MDTTMEEMVEETTEKVGSDMTMEECQPASLANNSCQDERQLHDNTEGIYKYDNICVYKI